MYRATPSHAAHSTGSIVTSGSSVESTASSALSARQHTSTPRGSVARGRARSNNCYGRGWWGYTPCQWCSLSDTFQDCPSAKSLGSMTSPAFSLQTRQHARARAAGRAAFTMTTAATLYDATLSHIAMTHHRRGLSLAFGCWFHAFWVVNVRKRIGAAQVCFRDKGPLLGGVPLQEQDTVPGTWFGRPVNEPTILDARCWSVNPVDVAIVADTTRHLKGSVSATEDFNGRVRQPLAVLGKLPLHFRKEIGRQLVQQVCRGIQKRKAFEMRRRHQKSAHQQKREGNRLPHRGVAGGLPFLRAQVGVRERGGRDITIHPCPRADPRRFSRFQTHCHWPELVPMPSSVVIIHCLKALSEMYLSPVDLIYTGLSDDSCGVSI